MLHSWVASLSFPGLVPMTDRLRGWACRHDPSQIAWLAAAVLCCSVSAEQVWGDVGVVGTEGKRAIVAAGFGYQIGAASTITVKVYDAESGDILSNEIYELAVKESDGVRSNGGPRIFAGGVGTGATDLSNFVLRVYDANTGVFQWEGRLNLVQPDWKAGAKIVSTPLPRRAIIGGRQAIEVFDQQPTFLLRATDVATGMLVWEDEFTTMGTQIPRAQPIADRSIQPNRIPSASSHTFNFTIRMYDPSGKKVLWEDQLSQQGSAEGPEQSHSDQADILPAWPNLTQEEPAEESI